MNISVSGIVISNMPTTTSIPIQRELFIDLSNYALTVGNSTEELANKLLQESLLRLARNEEMARRDAVLDELVAETEGLKLYDHYRLA